MSDQEIVWLYRWWSEEFYAAGFISPSEETVRSFRKWLRNSPKEKLEDYEREMIEIFNRQEAEDAGR